MRRFIALFGVMLFIMGVRLYNNGLLNCGYEGVISYGDYDTTVIEAPLLINGPHRIDISGGNEQVALDIIKNLNAHLLLTEEVDGIRIFYAYSPRLNESVCVHGKKVNLMIAVTGYGVSAGTPLLYGSY